MRAGLIGSGIGGSLTPAMHEAEGRALGLDYGYERFDTALPPWAGLPLAELLDRAEARGLRGVNITHPFKLAAAEIADECTGAAHDLGAVNTMVFEPGRRVGHNTDYTGFRAALARDLPGAGFDDVLLVGAGGAGAAVALALIDHGIGRVVIQDRAEGAAQALAHRIAGVRPGADVAAVPGRTFTGTAALDGVVNATPMGMSAYPGSSIDVARLPRKAWVADIVYFPLETALLAAARARGHRVMTGAGMAVFQAVGSFELFTGQAADPTRMTAHFERLQREKETATRDRLR